MDEEVRKAIRVFERAGMSANLLTYEMSWEELNRRYANLIRDKARAEGFIFDTVPIVNASVSRGSNSEKYTEKSLQGLVTKHLESLFAEKHGRSAVLSVKKRGDIFSHFDHYRIYEIETKAATVEQMLANYIQALSLTGWKRLLENFKVELEPGEQGAIIFMMNPKFDTYPNLSLNRIVVARMYTFREKKEEELAKIAARQAAKAAAEERARTKQETEEKRLLNRLFNKYGPPK